MLTLRNTSPALKVVFGLAAVLSLGACATASNSTFSCPAPDGFTCMSPAEVYEATNGDEIQSPVPAGKKQAKEQPATIIVQAPAAAAPVAASLTTARSWKKSSSAVWISRRCTKC